MENFGSIIKDIYLAPKEATKKKLRNSLAFKKQLIFQEWGKIAGDNLAGHAVPKHFRGAVLFVSATAAWANELNFFRRDLIDRINNYVAAEIVKDVRFVAWEGQSQSGERRAESGDLKKCEMWNVECGMKEENLASKFSIKSNASSLIPNSEFRIPNLGDSEISDFVKNIADPRLKNKITNAYRNLKRREALKIKNGFHRCKGENCRSLVAKGREYCAVCENVNRNKHLKRLGDYLTACPWANYVAAKDYEPCRMEEFNRVRQELLRRQASIVEYRGDASAVGPYTVDEYVLVMLYHSLPHEKLTDAVMSKTLYDLRGSLRNGPIVKPRSKANNIMWN